MKHVTTMSRNCMTRALSITLILGLLLSSLAFSPNLSEIFSTNVQAVGDGYWTDDGNYVTAWYDDHPDEPTYKIRTAEELAGLAKLVNDGTDTFADKTIKLTDDINLGEHEWVPIGSGGSLVKAVNYIPTEIFKGNFDGQGHEIKNMHIGTSEAPANYKYAGLFGYVTASAGQTVTIQNVNIDTGSWVYSEFLDGFPFAGGICAKANAEDSATLTISNCSNSAEIKVTGNDSSTCAGGICASACANTGSGTITIKNCRNNANIYTATNKIYTSNSVSMGGICAEVLAYNGTITINNCSNSAEIKATNNCDALVGGICAFTFANAHADAYAGADAKITISNCSNSGTITATVYDYTGTYAGGICAYASADADADAKITISNCSNSAGISSYVGIPSYADNSTPYGKAYAGGICAEAAGTITISNCYYKEGTAKTGIGKKEDQIDPEDQPGETTALPESQMTAATGTMGEDWVDITIDGNSKGKMALVDALNTWVKAYNDTTPAIKALEWKVTTGNYPTLNPNQNIASTETNTATDANAPADEGANTAIDIATDAPADEGANTAIDIATDAPADEGANVATDANAPYDTWCLCADGILRYIDANGMFDNSIEGRMENGASDYTYYSNGVRCHGFITIGSKQYLFNNGQMIKGCFYTYYIGNSKYACYVNKSGEVLQNFIGTFDVVRGTFIYTYNGRPGPNMISVPNEYIIYIESDGSVTIKPINNQQN